MHLLLPAFLNITMLRARACIRMTVKKLLSPKSVLQFKVVFKDASAYLTQECSAEAWSDRPRGEESTVGWQRSGVIGPSIRDSYWTAVCRALSLTRQGLDGHGYKGLRKLVDGLPAALAGLGAAVAAHAALQHLTEAGPPGCQPLGLTLQLPTSTLLQHHPLEGTAYWTTSVPVAGEPRAAILQGTV